MTGKIVKIISLGKNILKNTYYNVFRKRTSILKIDISVILQKIKEEKEMSSPSEVLCILPVSNYIKLPLTIVAPL